MRKRKESKKERIKQKGKENVETKKGKEMQKVCSPIFSERESSFSLDL